MATISFLLQKPYKKGTKTPSSNETRLYCFLILPEEKIEKTDNGTGKVTKDRIKRIIKIKTEHVIRPTEWDFVLQEKKKIRGTQAGNTELNEKIDQFNKDLRLLKEDILSQYKKITDHTDMQFSQVAKSLKVYGKSKDMPFLNKDKDFFQVFDEFSSSMEENVSPRTIQKYGTLKNSLKELGKVNPKYEFLSFSMMNKSFLTAFTKYLRNQKPRGRQKSRPEEDQNGLLNDTTGKYIETLKTFLKWAEEFPTEESPYNKFSAYKRFSNSGTKLEKKAEDIVTLTLSELRQFYTFDFSTSKDLTPQQQKSYGHVRNLFCFGCFTGQRWSDIERLDKSDIIADVWAFNAYKTKKKTEIYLTGFASPALDILKKYDFELPKISLQKFNLYLKKAAEAAGINTPVKIRRYVGLKEIVIVKPKYDFLGSHAGRRTCVSILLNDFNMNIAHVKEITGHSDLDTLQHYVNSDNQARRAAMSQTKSVIEPLTVVKQKAG